ncbi:hypothetical protein DFP72DRAFT_1090808 [Ephemerocybe angulata]|uniref:F-box domain-containing protein n=1 Tax=Ephemerocybe angulata TaxID=980116 RepID=A0A8H6LWW3_9AGAR|nr:hypothetical protein DFP72DRAFT_1090808 [Tulosesus angulatus]
MHSTFSPTIGVDDSDSIATKVNDADSEIPATAEVIYSDTIPATEVDCSDSNPTEVTVGLNSLPDEVLCEILHQVLAINESNRDNVTELQGLRQVSKKWDRTIMLNPRLWASIRRDYTASSSKAEEFLNYKATMDLTHYAKLSGALPLDLWLKLPQCMDRLDLERSIVNRARYLKLDLSVSAACNLSIPASTSNLRGGPSDTENMGWPLLENLDLVIRAHPERGPIFEILYEGPGMVAGRSLMPRLTELSIDTPTFPRDLNGTNIFAAGFPLSQLTCLNLAAFSDQDFSASIVMANACRDNLETLTLNFSRQKEPELGMDESAELDRILGDGPGIAFPKLKVLGLCVWHNEYFMSESDDRGGLDLDLSRVFILPFLEDLTIAYREYSKGRLGRTEGQQGKMKVSTLLSLVSHCGDKLRKLRLSDIHFVGDSDNLGSDPYTHILSHDAFKKLEVLSLYNDFLPFFGFPAKKLEDCTFLQNLRCLELAAGWHALGREQNRAASYEGLMRFYKGRTVHPNIEYFRHGRDCQLKSACGCATLEKCAFNEGSVYYDGQWERWGDSTDMGRLWDLWDARFQLAAVV